MKRGHPKSIDSQKLTFLLMTRQCTGMNMKLATNWL